VTNAEKRAIVGSLRQLAEHPKLSYVTPHYEGITSDLTAAASLIESTLPPPKSPGRALYETLMEKMGWLSKWANLSSGEQRNYEVVAKELGLIAQEQP
jgi:hypothetical protein